jgi:hypothetical protein
MKPPHLSKEQRLLSQTASVYILKISVLFLAYNKLLFRKPLPANFLDQINKRMGCSR